MTASPSSGRSPAATHLLALAVAVLFGAAAARAQVPSFQGVGDLTGGSVDSAALAISADASVVVGESESAAGTEAFQWTAGGGISGLGFLNVGDPFSSARGVSSDGSVIVGTSNDGSGVPRAYRFSASVMTALDTQTCSSCDPVTDAQGVSGDGLTAVGSSVARSGTGLIHLDPVRWPGGGTGISDLGNLTAPNEAGEAFGASSNGGVIVGSHLSNDGKDAWYWNGSGLNVLPTITGGSVIAAEGRAVSSDATTIVGYSNAGTVMLPGGSVVPTDLQAVRWTGAGFATLTQLGSLPGAPVTDSSALAVSQDGSLIVGRAVNSDVSDRAFLWDASNGMRDLKTVLVDDYGLDLTGWVLQEATGISDVVAGEFTIVGRGINPQGDPEGWVAFLSTPGCSDGSDNDSDTFTDHPADPQCNSPVDWTEENDCNDGIDNDGDGLVDHPADDGCRSASDPSEQPDCADALDNDLDGQTDFPADPGCASAASTVEDPACSNGVDDDLDLATDFPADTGCLAASDLSETPDCGDTLDNDGDGQTDFPADPECDSAVDPSEAAQCSDGVDNDQDGLVDYPDQYPGCLSPDDPIEAAQCSDGVDNDGDTFTDHPADTSCGSPDDVNEDPVTLATGDLFAVDRASRAVFRVDTTTGAQTLVSQGALMTAPQGIAQRGSELVVADPAGLIAVWGSGEQRLASPPLDDKESLQVVFDATGDAYVLEETEISTVDWSTTGLGAKSTWLAIPTPEPLPLLGAWQGDSLAVEANGDFVLGGLGFTGDGVFRVTTGQVVSILKPGFEDLRWLDLAVEDDDTILAAGFLFSAGPGVYRVDPTSGVSTPLNDTHAWQLPTGIVRDAAGEIYVADSGVCTDGTCVGGEIVHVDPGSGVVTSLSSGGFISGELDLVLLPEPGARPLWGSGVALLCLLSRRRSARRRGR